MRHGILLRKRIILVQRIWLIVSKIPSMIIDRSMILILDWFFYRFEYEEEESVHSRIKAHMFH